MSCLYEAELRAHYTALAEIMCAVEYKTELVQVNDYLLKVLIKDTDGSGGKLLIDYSPKKGKFGYRRDRDMSDSFFTKLSQHLDIINPALKDGKQQDRTKKAAFIKPEATTVACHAWVDGSYLNGHVGYGAAILLNDELVDEIYGEVTDPIAIQSRQVGGELRAVMEALRWAKAHGQKEMVVFFDFLNIEKWAIGAYKTNNEMTKAYKAYVAASPVRVIWNKIDSHTGVAWNDYADQLAKRGAMGEQTKEKKDACMDNQ